MELEASGPLAGLPKAVNLTREDGSQALISAKASGAGVALIRAFDRAWPLAGISNPVGVGFCDPDERIVFGDLHGQMYVSIGTGTLDEYYTWAREVQGLDFCAPANHYGGRMDFDNVPDWDTERHEAHDALWPEDVAKSNRYYSPGEFITLVSFECALGRYGHKNVYYRGDSGIYIYGQAGLTPDEMWRQLEEEGYRAITIPHHPKFCGVTDWSYRNDKFQRLVEICSAWGISEASGPHSVRAALAMGHRLGFVGGTDTHFGQPGRPPHFFGEGAGWRVYVTALTREALWMPLRAALCHYRGPSFCGWMSTGHHGSGLRPMRCGWRHVVGRCRLRGDIIRNGSVVHSRVPGYEHRLSGTTATRPAGERETPSR